MGVPPALPDIEHLEFLLCSKHILNMRSELLLQLIFCEIKNTNSSKCVEMLSVIATCTRLP